jgi:hypothetical protein
MVAYTRHYYSGSARCFTDRWRLISTGPVYLFIVLNENEKRNHNTDCNNRRFLNSFPFAEKLLAGNYCNGHLFARILHPMVGGSYSQGMDGAGENPGLDQQPHHPVHCVLFHPHSHCFFCPDERKTEF